MIYRAIVSDNRDPRSKGRLKVSIPVLFGANVTDWIWPMVSAGYHVIPDPGAQVWVAFENGDKETPVWMGEAKPTARYANLVGRVETNTADILYMQEHPTVGPTGPIGPTGLTGPTGPAGADGGGLSLRGVGSVCPDPAA